MRKHFIKLCILLSAYFLISCTPSPTTEECPNSATESIDDGINMISQNISADKLPIAVISEETGLSTSSDFFICGKTNENLTFNWLNLGTTNSDNDDFIDNLNIPSTEKSIFVSRYNKSGVQQSTEIIGAYSDFLEISSIEQTSYGYNIYGLFKGELTLGEETITSGTKSIFLASFKNNKLEWLRQILCTGYMNTGKIFVTKNACYITGSFSGEATFPNFITYKIDPITKFPIPPEILLIKKLTSVSNSSDGFLAKYNYQGNLHWVRTISGVKDNHINDVEVKDNHIFVTGFISDTVELKYTKKDTLSIINPVTNKKENRLKVTEEEIEIGTKTKDCIVARYNVNGYALWVKKFGGDGIDEGIGLCLTHQTYLYVGGNYNSNQIIFSSQLFSEDTLKNKGIQDIFRLYMNPVDGSLLLAEGIGSKEADYCTGIYHNRLKGKQYKEYIHGIFSDTLWLSPSLFIFDHANPKNYSSAFLLHTQLIQKIQNPYTTFYFTNGYVISGMTERSFAFAGGSAPQHNNPKYILGSIKLKCAQLNDKTEEISNFNMKNNLIKSVLWEIPTSYEVNTEGDPDPIEVD